MTGALTAEWIAKAESDRRVVDLVRQQDREALPDMVCYHCQQCAEKYLKAFLVANGISVPKTHDLPELLARCVAIDGTLTELTEPAAGLTDFGILPRYPGMNPLPEEAEEAVEMMELIRGAARIRLGLSPASDTLRSAGG